MAADWIKMRTDLYRDPKVSIMADFLMNPAGQLARFVNQQRQRDMTVTRNVMRNVTVGALLAVWGVARQRGMRVGDDLRINGVTPAVLDDICELPGFGDAMEACGWLEEDGEGLVFPRFFAAHNADPRESDREKNRLRQQRFRESRRNVTRNVTSNVREEKRREKDISPPTPPRKSNPWWDAVVAIWFTDGVSKSQRTRVGRLASEFKMLGATENEMRKRRARIREAWGAGKDTPDSVLKHWGEFTEDARPSPGQPQSSPARVQAKPGKYDNFPYANKPKDESDA